MTVNASGSFDLDRPWRLHSQVAIRPERFGALAYHFGTRRLSFLKSRKLLAVVRGARRAAQRAGGVPLRGGQRRRAAGLRAGARDAGGVRHAHGTGRRMSATAATGRSLVDHFESGLDAPICLTWELTYACNLACVHCLSSSGRRDPRELSTEECRRVVDELQRMQVFYVNIGGGEPTVRRDFWELLEYATAHDVGVKFSTNGSRITRRRARALAANDYLDVQISLDGATAEVNDAVRGPGSYATAVRAMECLAAAGMENFKISVVVTRHNVAQLDAFEAIAARYGAQLRLTRLRPSGRGADVWDELHPTAAQQRAALRLADGARRARPHRGLVLSPGRVRRRPPRPEPVRRRARGLPHRPRRRRVRVPLRDPRCLPGRQRARRRRLCRGVARVGAVRGAAQPADRRGVRVVRALTTPAAAGAWPPSSSRASPWTGPTPSACSDTARPFWPRRGERGGFRRPAPTTPGALPGVPARVRSIRWPART